MEDQLSTLPVEREIFPMFERQTDLLGIILIVIGDVIHPFRSGLRIETVSYTHLTLPTI